MKVFKIALPGHDIGDAQLKDEAVNSLYSSPKVDTTASPPHAGIINLSWNDVTPIAGGTVRTIHSFRHNYGHVPTVIAAFSFDNGTNTAKGVLPLFVGALATITMDSDAQNVSLKYISSDLASTPIPPFTMRIRFYVFAERGVDY